MKNQYEIGQYIQKRRKDIGLTQKQLADQLNVSAQAVSKWETGDTLPDTTLLLDLSDLLETTVDKILSGGKIVMKKHNKINLEHIVEGLDAISKLKTLLGEKSTFYQGAIEGINKKMNIDFEAYYQDDYTKEVMLTEVIIQYIIDGYETSKEEIDHYIKSSKMRNIIYKYIGEKNTIKHLTYQDDPKLFELIRSLEPEFKTINTLNQLPGEFIRMENGKNYWGTEVETQKDFCFGIAVDEDKIYVFSYGYGGQDSKLVHEVKRT